MRRSIAMAALAMAVWSLALSGLGSSAQAPAAGQPRQADKAGQQAGQSRQLQQEFIKLEQEWMEAVRKQDERTLDRLMAGDFVQTTSMMPGGGTDKAQFIQASVQLTARLGSFNFDQVVVRLVGDVAVVNALYSQKGRQGGISVSGDYFLTDIWVKRDNRWQVLSRNLLRAEKEATLAGGAQAAEGRNRPLGPCQSACREQFTAASTLCRVKSGEGDDESTDLDIACMQVATAALRSCQAACRNARNVRNAKSADGAKNARP